MSRPAASPGRYAIAAFDALTAHIAILNRDGVIQAVNQAWIRFAEANDAADFVGTNYLLVCDGAQGEDQPDAAQIAAGIRAVLAGTQEAFELEYPCHSPTEDRYFLARVTCFAQDGAQYAVVAHENITRRKQAEMSLRQLNRTLEQRVEARTQEIATINQALERKNAELERSVRDLGEFAYVASHDLQEPLRTLGMYTDLLRHRYHDQLDDRAHGYITHITEQVFRARQLVRDVLTLSSVNAEAEPDLGAVYLQACWEAVTPGLPWPEDAIATCGILPPVQASAPQIQQLLTNLLGNAIKFRSERPLRVSLTGWQQDDWVHCTLRDNGIGIAPEHHEKVFLMFQRLHRRTSAGGNGIGLAVCRRIVERYGGRIWFGDGAGEGATIHFTLPARGESPAAP